jgi:hypothetical protein
MNPPGRSLPSADQKYFVIRNDWWYRQWLASIENPSVFDVRYGSTRSQVPPRVTGYPLVMPGGQ